MCVSACARCLDPGMERAGAGPRCRRWPESHLTPAGLGQTRVHVRVRGRVEPRWLSLAYVALVPPADLVMCAGMLRGLARRVAT